MMEPRNPPAIVMYSVPEICCLKICCTAKRTTAKVMDTMQDTLVGRAESESQMKHNHLKMPF